MVFSSTFFIFCFLPLTLIFYYIFFSLRNEHHIDIANIVLLIASMIFYAWGGTRYFLILMAVILINYVLTIIMDSCTRLRGMLFVLILAIDLGNLLYYKYFNFFVENARSLASAFNLDILGAAAQVALPIGISFYTFQIISYVADVYRGSAPVQKSFVKLALYVTMFPQLIAGPIVRYTDVNTAMNDRSISRADIEYGIRRFIIGFAKKVFIANNMGRIADAAFAIPQDLNTAYAWLGAVCYTLQIYYDFSAYSDMAIGLGRMLGFHFNENFNLPYISQSIQEFWRRWHISLSSWFRDYVYIPLGGNRRGTVRTYINLVTVFFLTGFWHGAAWQFIFWGLYHGAFSIAERLGFNKILKSCPSVLRHAYTLLAVIIGWVFFRADTMGDAVLYLKSMFSFDFSYWAVYSILAELDSLFIVCFAAAVIFSFTKLECLQKLRFWNSSACVNVRYISLWLMSVLYLIGLSYNPFIYFKF